MIRYSLVCDEDHAFEAWFRDSAAFDDQDRRGLLACPICESSCVRKALMAPAIRRRGAKAESSPARPEIAPAPVTSPPPVPVAMEPALVADEKSRELRAMLRELHAKVKASAENVGAAFPQEARKIHDGDTPARAIYGTATGEEVRALIEDGVDITPLPPLPDDRN